MPRLRGALLLITALAPGCGPDSGPLDCSGPGPNFVVVLKRAEGALPTDLTLHVSYGSGMEDYHLLESGAVHEVIFCRPADAQGVPSSTAQDVVGSAGAAEAAGAGGEGPPLGVEALSCGLWTAGFTKLIVSADELTTTEYDLTPREHECTVKQVIVLDSSDAG